MLPIPDGVPLMSPPTFDSYEDDIMMQLSRHGQFAEAATAAEVTDSSKKGKKKKEKERKKKEKERKKKKGKDEGPVNFSRLVGPKGSTDSTGGMAWDPT